MITHKLVSVKNFDEIFVVYKGKIHEQGDFEELMKQDGLFASMYKQQTRF
jgi:ABC-type multidrug transport system fused ATPase/permease subunit